MTTDEAVVGASIRATPGSVNRGGARFHTVSAGEAESLRAALV